MPTPRLTGLYVRIARTPSILMIPPARDTRKTYLLSDGMAALPVSQSIGTASNCPAGVSIVFVSPTSRPNRMGARSRRLAVLSPLSPCLIGNVNTQTGTIYASPSSAVLKIPPGFRLCWTACVSRRSPRR
jgi:hypothetical protein